MRHFLLGLFVAYGAAVAAALWLSRPAPVEWPEPGSWVQVTFGMLIAPVLTAWAAAEIVNLRALRRGRGSTTEAFFRPLLAGVSAGVTGLGLAAVALPLLDRFVPDAALTAAASGASALVFVSLVRRARPGSCPACGFDLSGNTPACKGRCPECGLALFATQPNPGGRFAATPSSRSRAMPMPHSPPSS
ncbi:MAG: hypothetical protein JNM07_04385 [Phycisphaerae bacterium]|nr:hypothetical protein [Phycisphaerae bacterium]